MWKSLEELSFKPHFFWSKRELQAEFMSGVHWMYVSSLHGCSVKLLFCLCLYRALLMQMKTDVMVIFVGHFNEDEVSS